MELGLFSDGVNLSDPLTSLKPTECSIALNVELGVRGDISKRLGHGDYGSAPAKINGDNLVNLNLRYYRTDGVKKTICAAGGKLRFGDDSTGAWTDISIDGSGASMHATNLCDWMVYKNRLYITDGTRPQRYNNVDDIFAGLVTMAAPTLAQTTGGFLTASGVYKYLTTSIAGDLGEGPPGASATITLSGSNSKVNLSNILDAAAKYGETFKRIYRTKAGGTLYYFLTDIAHGVTVFSDTIADSSLGDELVPSHVPPADCRFCIMGHDERAYWFGRSGVNASIVDVSDVGFPDRIADTSNFTVSNNDGDDLRGGCKIPGGLLFFKRTSIWLMRGFGFGLSNIRPSDKNSRGVGTTSPFSIVYTPIGAIFLSQAGEVYKYDGSSLDEIGYKVNTEFANMPQAARERVVACYYKYKYRISYDPRGLKGYNWATLKYDIRTGKWEGPDYNFDFQTPSYYSVWDSNYDLGQLSWGEARAAAGSYLRLQTEFSKTDRGTKFISRVRSGAITAELGEIETIKGVVQGEFSSDVTLTLSHIDENDEVISENFNNPVISQTAKFNSGYTYNPDDTPGNSIVAKFGGNIKNVMEAPLDRARSRMPRYELSDGGTGIEMNIHKIQIVAKSLPL